MDYLRLAAKDNLLRTMRCTLFSLSFGTWTIMVNNEMDDILQENREWRC